MKNRGRVFGIAVVADSRVVAQAIAPYGDDKLIVRVRLHREHEWDFTLSVALEGARWKAIMGRMTTGSLDVARVKADISTAFAIANRFAEVKKKVTASMNQLTGISDYLDDIKRDLVTVLQRIHDTVLEERPIPEAA